MSKEIEERLLKLFDKAWETGEKGIDLIVKEAPDVLVNYIHFVIFKNAISAFLFSSATILCGWIVLKTYKKCDFNIVQNDDAGPYIPITILFGFGGVITLVFSIEAFYSLIVNAGHYMLSPATAIYEHFMALKNK